MLGLLRRFLDLPAAPLAMGAVHDTPAYRVMRAFNPHGLIGVDGDTLCMVEDWSDPDGRMFRLEHQSTPDARHAIAWCRHNPWGSVSEIHTTQGGLICLGAGAHHASHPARSDFSLDKAIARARFWCTAVSVYHETGNFPNA